MEWRHPLPSPSWSGSSAARSPRRWSSNGSSTAYRATVLHLYTWDKIQFSPEIPSRLCSQNLSLGCINLAGIRQLIWSFSSNQLHIQDFREIPPIVEDCQTSFVIVLLQTLHGQTTGVPHLQPGILIQWRIEKYRQRFDRQVPQPLLLAMFIRKLGNLTTLWLTCLPSTPESCLAVSF